MQAFAALSTAAHEDPASAEPQAALGTLYKACGMLSEAVSAFEVALKLSPGDAELSKSQAALLTDQGESLTQL